MDMEELWSKTREVLRAEVNAVVYNSLLGSNNLVPALLDGDTLVLRVVMDNLKLLITNQWYSTIVRALSQVAGHQMDVEILTQEEIEARPQLKAEGGGGAGDGAGKLGRPEPEVHLRDVRRRQRQPFCPCRRAVRRH